MSVKTVKEAINDALVQSFENEWSDWLGIKHTIGVANGMDAIELGLRILDIKKGDYEKTKLFHVKNFSFFGAPVGLLFTIEYDLGWMSWLDYGMFIQNICVAARAYGIHTCPQAAWSSVHNDIAPLINISDNHLIHCGMSLGIEDTNAKVNNLRTERANLNEFVNFHS